MGNSLGNLCWEYVLFLGSSKSKVCFVAEGLLCWKLVAAMKERPGQTAESRK